MQEHRRSRRNVKAKSLCFHGNLILTFFITDDFNENTDDPDSEGKCSIVIALMQEHRRSRRNVKVKSLQIGFMIYQVIV